MSSPLNAATTPANFTLLWVIIVCFVLLQGLSIVLCQTLATQIQQPIAQEQVVLIRTLLYVLTIVLFPLTRLIRYSQVRLNQTMPGEKTAQQRYFFTVLVSQVLISSVGLFGFILFIVGDTFNTLIIFSGLALLGFFLYRPLQAEYDSIVAALTHSD